MITMFPVSRPVAPSPVGFPNVIGQNLGSYSPNAEDPNNPAIQFGNPRGIYPAETIAKTLAQKASVNAAVQDNYKIKKGDTLGALARRFGVPIPILAQFNDISNPNKIKEGNSLIIPQPGPGGTFQPPQPEAPPPPPPPPPPPKPKPEPAHDIGMPVLTRSEWAKLAKTGGLPDMSVTVADPPPPPKPQPPQDAPTYKADGPPVDPTKLPGMWGKIHESIDPQAILGGGSPLATALMGLGGGMKPVAPMPNAGMIRPVGPPVEPVAPSNFGPETVTHGANTGYGARPEPWSNPQARTPMATPEPPMYGYKPNGPLDQGFRADPPMGTPMGKPISSKVPTLDGRIEPTFPKPGKSRAQKDIDNMWRRHATAIKKQGSKKVVTDPEMVNKVIQMMRMKGGFNG